MKTKINDIEDKITNLYLYVERLKAYNDITTDLLHKIDIDKDDASKLTAINYASKQDINTLTDKLETIDKTLLKMQSVSD